MQSLWSRLRSTDSRPWPSCPVPIAFVITDLDVGGAEKALVALATRLDRSRWNPSVVCLGPEMSLVAPLRAVGIPVTCLDADRRRPIASVARLARALRAIRPAIVQSFLFHANLAARLAAPAAGRPWVVGGIRVAEREKLWHLRLDRLTQRFSTGSICVSQGVYEYSRDVGHIAPDRLMTIPNGIDPAPYDRARAVDRATLGVEESERLLLFVGRVTAQKGLSILLPAFETLLSEGAGWTLLIVGDGPDRPALEAVTGANPSLAARVRWLGRRDDVPSLLRTADLLVLPSLWEGMPNVVLEAMAARLPVVASRVEGSDELIVAEGDDRTGWLVPPGDLPALTRTLREAMGAPDRFARMGANGRALVDRRFTMARVVTAYEQSWAGILGLDPDRVTECPSVPG